MEHKLTLEDALRRGQAFSPGQLPDTRWYYEPMAVISGTDMMFDQVWVKRDIRDSSYRVVETFHGWSLDQEVFPFSRRKTGREQADLAD